VWDFNLTLLWIKRRSGTAEHKLNDVVRGAGLELATDTTGAELDRTYFTSFDTDGFTVNGTVSNYNGNGDTYASWSWLAGGTASSNTDGDITSSVSANTTSGFSIVSYTGTGAVGTIGHGLGQLPAMIIFKNRSSATDWMVFHKNSQSSYSFSATAFLTLNLTSAVNGTGVGGVMNDTAPTTSLFTVGNDSRSNGSGNSMIAYCFAEKKGFSKAFSYTGNGSADGNFVYCGFRPAFVLIKCTSNATDWFINDNKRLGYNGGNNVLYPDLSSAEATSPQVDILSNGFKTRTVDSMINNSGFTYVGFAFAEQPFVTSTTNGSIPATAR
jgi:hypothetical protein